MSHCYLPGCGKNAYARQFSSPVYTIPVCPLCLINASRKKVFYCQECVLNHGNQEKTSVLDIKSKLNQENSRKELLLQELSELNLSPKQTDISTRIEELHSKISLLRDQIIRVKGQNKLKSKKLATLRALVKDGKIQEVNHGEKYTRSFDNLRALNSKHSDAISNSKRMESELLTVRLRIAFDLFCNVIPIIRIDPSPAPEVIENVQKSNEESDKESMIALLLAEAQRCTYANGRWIETNTPVIVPPNGYKILTALLTPDYSASNYVPFGVDISSQGVSMTSSDASIVSQGPGAFVSKDLAIGFSYMNQLVISLAAIFHVFLPFPLSVFHKDILNGRLTTEQFKLFAGRVCANVFYLCNSLGMNITTLRPTNPAANLCLLCDYLCNIDPHSCPALPLLARPIPAEILAELLRHTDVSNADSLMSNIIATPCAYTSDQALLECLHEDEEWVMPDGQQHFSEPQSPEFMPIDHPSILASTNPLLPSTIHNFISFIRGRSSSHHG